MLILLRHAALVATSRTAAGPGRADLLVCNGVIEAIAPSTQPFPAQAFDALRDGGLLEEVDCSGLTVIPGLIDPHVHLTGGGGEAGPSSRVPRVVLTELTSAGVTTAVGVLGTDGTTRTMADLVATVLGLREEGLSAWCYTGSYELPLRTLTGSVRQDIVFVDPILGVGELAISDHRSSQPTFDELIRIAADCHVAGLATGKAGVLHLHLGDGPRGLALVRRALEETELPARVFYPTHVNRQRRLFAEAMELASRFAITVDVTAYPPDEDDPGLTAADAIAAWLDAGLPAERLTCSADAGGCLPTFDAEGCLVHYDVGRASALLDTLRQLLQRGRTLEQVLPCFTNAAARLLRLRGKGTVDVGADADLVALDADGRVVWVMGRGRWLVRDGMPQRLGSFESAARGGSHSQGEQR